MNNVLKLCLLLLLSCFYGKTQAQCNPEDCIVKLKDGYTFLKTYKVEEGTPQKETSYVFSKETNYMLLLCNKEGGPQNVIATLYDANKREVATNFDKKNNKFFPAFIYNCKVTGIYYMTLSSAEKTECCNGILAFKK